MHLELRGGLPLSTELSRKVFALHGYEILEKKQVRGLSVYPIT